MRKPERRRDKDERYRSDEQEEKAITAEERLRGQRTYESWYGVRLKDGFRMLHSDE